jgi:hypothetical protein
MWIHVRPASANLLLEVERPADDVSDPAKRKEYISFQILPAAEADHLDLDTGEIFQDYNYARIHNRHDKLISARLIVEPAADNPDYKRNRMSYSDAVQESSTLSRRPSFSAYTSNQLHFENWRTT